MISSVVFARWFMEISWGRGRGGEIRSARERFELEICGVMRAFFVSVVDLIY